MPYQEATTTKQTPKAGKVRSRTGTLRSIQLAGNRRVIQHAVEVTTVTTRRIFSFAKKTSEEN